MGLRERRGIAVDDFVGGVEKERWVGQGKRVKGGKDGVGGINKVVFCCWGEMSALGQTEGTGYSAMGDIPDIFMRADLDNKHKKKSMGRTLRHEAALSLFHQTMPGRLSLECGEMWGKCCSRQSFPTLRVLYWPSPNDPRTDVFGTVESQVFPVFIYQ